MKKYILFIAFGVLVSCDQDGSKDTVKPRLTDITELVYASVVIKPEQYYFAQPTGTGIISGIFVEEGEEVEKGQLLASISASADLENRVTNAKINLKEAKENLKGEDNRLINIELELKSLREQLALDSLNYFRQKTLWESNIGKKMDLERYELAYTVTQNNYKNLLQKKAQTINELENQYQKASSQVNTELALLDEFSLQAAMSGIVYTLNKKEGDLITTQEYFAEIGSADNFVVEMDVDEEDIIKIALGDTVAITLNAYNKEVFLAQVSKVFPKKDEVTQTFRVESIFIQQPPKLYNGLSGEGNIKVGQRENTMVIPSEYLISGNKILTKGGERSVTTGVKNINFIEILSGIDTSTVLLKPQK